MCSEGLSVWFACKLCKSFFLNADDFAYHKKKSHVQEFRTTKFIVFEEQTTPPASPPENWVSFLSPKEETRIHKIISPPSPPVLTNAEGNPCNEMIQHNQNKEFIETDLESSNIFISDGHYEDESGDGDADEVSNNCFELNCGFNSLKNDANNVRDVTKNAPLQSIIAPTYYNLTDEQRKKHFRSRIKPTLNSSTTNYRLKSRKRWDIQNPVSLSSNILQTVIQSPKNPYVYLKRLKIVAKNESSDTNNDDLTANSANEPQVADPLEVEVGSNKKIQPDFLLNNCSNNSLINLPISINHQGGINNTDFNLHHVDVDLDAVFKTDNNYGVDIDSDVSEEIITPQNQVCDNTRNISAFHESSFTSESILPNAEAETKTLKSSLNSVLYKCRFCCKKIKSEFFQKHVELCKNRSSNQEPQSDFASYSTNLIPADDPTTEVSLNYNYDDLSVSVGVVKTEDVSDENEDDSEFLYEAHDPFEYVSQNGLLGEGLLNVSKNSNNLEEIQTPQPGGYHCTSCKKHFIHLRDIKTHNKNYHETQDGKRRFGCPHPKCVVTTSRQDHLKRHLKQVHFNSRPFKCPHPKCKMLF